MKNFQVRSRRLHEAEKEIYKDEPHALESASSNIEEISADMERW